MTEKTDLSKTAEQVSDAMQNDLSRMFEQDESKDPKIQQRVAEFQKLIEEEQFTKKLLEDIQANRMKAEETLFATLEDAGFKSISTDDQTFYRRLDFYASIEAEKKQEGLKWLRELGSGSLIQENVNARTFSAFIKDLKSSDEKIELPEFVKTHVKKKIGHRKR